MRPPPLPRTVILDYYDSYTNNILTLFTKLYSDDEVLKKVVVIKADKYTWQDFQHQVLPHVDCVVLSPGPGRPDNPTDIGFALDLLRAHPVPILGICLGHQAIGVAFGGKIINTPKITHGHVVPIRPIPDTGLFDSEAWREAGAADEFEVVVYNSLTVDPDSIPDELEITAWSASPNAQPTVQGLAHRQYPIWGVQYHPESISSTRGAALLHSFLSRVHTANPTHPSAMDPSSTGFSSASASSPNGSSPTSYPPLPEHIISSCAYRVSAGSSRRKMPLMSPTPMPTPPLTPVASFANLAGMRANGSGTVSGGVGDGTGSSLTGANAEGEILKLVEKRYGAVGREARTEDVFQRDFFGGGKGRGVGDVWLDGRTPTRPTNSSLSNPSFLLTYSLATRRITLYRPPPSPSSSFPASPTCSLQLEDETFWDLFSSLQSALSARLHKPGRSTHGWRGGWAGWFGYEMKEESLAGYRRKPVKERAGEEKGEEVEEVDAAWGWCDRVLERTRDGEWVARGVIGEGSAAHGSLHNNESNGSDGIEETGSNILLEWLQAQGITFGLPRTDFDDWCDTLELDLASSAHDVALIQPAEAFPPFRPVATGSDYTHRIEQCREAIRQGESYELTLTTSFTSTLPSTSSSPASSSTSTIPSSPTSPSPHISPQQAKALSLYLRQRTHNPAYYSTFISFPSLLTAKGRGITVLSSSPERFLRIDEGVVEMMPIKGTRARVKVGQCVCQEGRGCGGARRAGKGEGEDGHGGKAEMAEACMKEGEEEDRRRGEALRNDPKERAENLMIVDLIRSDLLSCCTPSSVVVPKLIALESYGVHNLVTTVRGQVAQNVGTVEAVRRCFPPGSMTGAPKLRSVQMLEGFEGQPKRGIYSGALGYISLDGTTDLSVVIRTMVLEGEELSLGAGGAITWLSNPDGEWDEVLTKVKSVVGTVQGI